jgi:hypothetical protein
MVSSSIRKNSEYGNFFRRARRKVL